MGLYDNVVPINCTFAKKNDMFTSSQLELVSDGSFRPPLFTHTFVYRSRHRSSIERTVCKKWGAKTKYVNGNIDISTC